MRILYFAKDAPFVNSGYGKCCREICLRLRRLGHDVAVFATVGNRSSFLFEWMGLKIYPGLDNVFGEDIFLDHYNHWKADLLITQLDLWPMSGIPSQAITGEINWAPYVPLDSYPLPDILTSKLPGAIHIISMCDWAREQMSKLGYDVTSIHHGVDTDIYKIIYNRSKLKAELGLPKDCYLIGMVQANQFLRKAYDEQFQGIKLFIDQNPNLDVRVYCHTAPSSGESWNLVELAKHYELDKILSFPNIYKYVLGYNEHQMSRIYNSFDVLLSATNGEGFGLPCYLPKSKILDGKGFKNIEDLKINDTVISHTGELKRITKTFKRKVEEEILEIKIVGMPSIKITHNHPLFAICRNTNKFKNFQKKIPEPKWIPAGQLSKNDFLVIPKLKVFKSQENLDIGQYIKINGRFLISKFSNHGKNTTTNSDIAKLAGFSNRHVQRITQKNELNQISEITKQKILVAMETLKWKTSPMPSRWVPLNENTGFFFGMYLAEGSLGTNGQIEFDLHIKETEFSDRLKNVIENVFHLPYKEYFPSGKNVRRLITCCKPLAEFLMKTCSKGAWNKHLPPFTFDNQNFAKGILKGMSLGDGSFGKVFQFTTVSEQLSYGFYQLLLAFEIFGSLRWDERKNDKKKKGNWSITIAGTQLQAFFNIFNLFDRKKIKRQRFINQTNYFLVPITQITKEKYSGFVYNLEVEDDNSYCVNGIASHNCIEAQACGIPVVATDCMSFPELVKYGALVKVKDWIRMSIMLRKAIPDPLDIAAKLRQVSEIEWNRKEISETAHYLWNWDSKIIQEWMWTLQIIEDKISKQCRKLPKPSKLAKRLSREVING